MSSSVVSGGSSAVVQFTESPSSGYLANQSIQIPSAGERVRAYFSPGTAADKCDGLAALSLTFAPSVPQNVDLLALIDIITGAALTVARVRFFLIKVLSQVDAAVLLVGGAGANEWDGFLSSGGKMTVFPSSAANDGFTEIAAPNNTGIPVTAGSHILKLDPGANAMTVVVLIGTASV